MNVAGYRFSLDSMNASKIRSKFNDTDVASLGVSVNGTMVRHVTKELGDISGGNHAIGLSAPVIVPEHASVAFAYQIVNSGYDRNSATKVKGVMNQLSDAAAKLCTGLFGYAAVWDKLNQFTHWLNDLQFFDCDGVVAADAVSVSADTLQDWTHNGAVHRETRRYPGSNSPVGCGENSLYFVAWSVTRLSSQEIAQLERAAM